MLKPASRNIFSPINQLYRSATLAEYWTRFSFHDIYNVECYVEAKFTSKLVIKLWLFFKIVVKVSIQVKI